MKRALLAGIAAVALSGTAGPAFAFDDGYQNVFSSVLTAVGVMPPPEAPEIDYRERPPLVVPPKTSLVNPTEPGANRSAAWPTDPDVTRRRKAAEEARAPIKLPGRSDRAVSRQDMMTYRASETEQDPRTLPCKVYHGSHDCGNSDIREMRAQEERYRAANPEKVETAAVGVEPERQYLTQPPKGYLKATKEVKLTHEAPVSRHDESRPQGPDRAHDDDKNIDPLNN